MEGITALGCASLTAPLTYVLIAGVALLAIPAIRVVYSWFDSCREQSVFSDDQSFSIFGRMIRSHALITLCACVIFLCWVPVWLSMFPGINGYDYIYQVEMFLSGNITSHHPVLHTVLLGNCVKIGLLLGQVWIGVALYTFIQMVIMAGIFGFASACIFEMTHSKGWLLATVAWFAFCPLNSVLAISTTKDGLFGAFVLLAICAFI